MDKNLVNKAFSDLRPLRNWVSLLLFGQIIVAIMSIMSNYLEYQLLLDFSEGVYVLRESIDRDANANDARQLSLVSLYYLTFIISGILILRWIYLANKNAHTLSQQEMRFSPGWSVGYFFIPILSLFKPYQVMKEIWAVSHFRLNAEKSDYHSTVQLWWFLWLSSFLSERIANRITNSAETTADFMQANIGHQITGVISIALAVVTLSLVNQITKAQFSSHFLSNNEQQKYKKSKSVINKVGITLYSALYVGWSSAVWLPVLQQTETRQAELQLFSDFSVDAEKIIKAYEDYSLQNLTWPYDETVIAVQAVDEDITYSVKEERLTIRQEEIAALLSMKASFENGRIIWQCEYTRVSSRGVPTQCK